MCYGRRGMSEPIDSMAGTAAGDATAALADDGAAPFDHLHGHHELSAVLRALSAHTEPTITFRTMITALGSRAHGMALLIFILPEVVPLPVPSIGAILGIPLILIAGHLALFGEHAGFPQRLMRVSIPVSALRAVTRYVAPVLDRFEDMARPRWLTLARMERLAGVVCLYLALILFLPIPFFNFPPSICLAMIAFGIVVRDGMVVASGYAATALLTAALAFIMQFLVAQISTWNFFG